jgi:hypothetical protein
LSLVVRWFFVAVGCCGFGWLVVVVVGFLLLLVVVVVVVNFGGYFWVWGFGKGGGSLLEDGVLCVDDRFVSSLIDRRMG